MFKLDVEDLTDLVALEYASTNNGADFGEDDDSVIAHMIISYHNMIISTGKHIRRTKRIINLFEVIGCMISVFLLVTNYAPKMLNYAVVTTSLILLFDIFYRIRIRNYLVNCLAYMSCQMAIIYHYIRDIRIEDSDDDENVLVNTFNKVVDTGCDFLNS